jgi:hypothetical protein
VALPDSTAPSAWSKGIATARARLSAAEASASTDAELILGSQPKFETEAQEKQFLKELDAAEALMSGPALKALPSMEVVNRLGQLAPNELTTVEAAIVGVQDEARAVAKRLIDTRGAARLRLYSLVARRHEQNHPGEPINICPVCQRGLEDDADVPRDALLSLSVREALEASRAADAAATKTGADWERDRKLEFYGGLPEPIKRFVEEDRPNNLMEFYRSALTSELFESTDMPRSLKPLARHAAAIWNAASANAPKMEPGSEIVLPNEIPDHGGLRTLLTKTALAIRCSRYRLANGRFAQNAIKQTLQEAAGQDELPANMRPLRLQISVLRQYAQSAQQTGAVRRQLKQIETSCLSWSSSLERLAKLARAADAVLPFLALPALVQQQVGGLIQELNTSAMTGPIECTERNS